MAVKHTITVIISGESAIFCLMNGTEIKYRVFCANLDHAPRTELPDMLHKFPLAPVYVLVDTPEQNYTRQSMPGVSAMGISKLVNKRLTRDYPEEDLKGAIACGREKTGRRDWQYLFVHAPMTDDLRDWLGFLAKKSNPFMGIFLLPLESAHMIRTLRKAEEKDKKKRGDKAVKGKKGGKSKEETAEWTFLSLTQKSGGIRQIVFRNDQVFFTRYVRYQINSVPEVLAGVIEQEMVNTTDYLRRLSYNENEEARALIVTSNEIKTALSGGEIAGMRADIYSPYEFSVKTGLAGVCRLEDKYADILAAAIFLKYKPHLKLFTPPLKKNNTIYNAGKVMRYAAASLVPVFFAVSGYLGWSILNVKEEAAGLENRKVTLNKQMKEEINASEKVDKEKAERVLSGVALYQELDKQSSAAPETILKALASVNDPSMRVNNLRWNYTPAEKRGRGFTEESEKAQVSLDFYNQGQSPDSLFNNFELFTQKVSGAFEEYDVQYSKLPDRLTFDSTTNIVPVTLTILRKDEDGDKKRR